MLFVSFGIWIKSPSLSLRHGVGGRIRRMWQTTSETLLRSSGTVTFAGSMPHPRMRRGEMAAEYCEV